MGPLKKIFFRFFCIFSLGPPCSPPRTGGTYKKEGGGSPVSGYLALCCHVAAPSAGLSGSPMATVPCFSTTGLMR